MAHLGSTCEFTADEVESYWNLKDIGSSKNPTGGQLDFGLETLSRETSCTHVDSDLLN